MSQTSKINDVYEFSFVLFLFKAIVFLNVWLGIFLIVEIAVSTPQEKRIVKHKTDRRMWNDVKYSKLIFENNYGVNETDILVPSYIAKKIALGDTVLLSYTWLFQDPKSLTKNLRSGRMLKFNFQPSAQLAISIIFWIVCFGLVFFFSDSGLAWNRKKLPYFVLFMPIWDWLGYFSAMVFLPIILSIPYWIKIIRLFLR
jgi:hypothetical protein